jgi:anti-sigma B factor antagonist
METLLTFEDAIALIKVKGMVTTDNVHLFQEKLDDVKNSDSKTLHLDFLSCQIICSTGIGKLLMFCKEFIPKGGKVEIVKCSASVYELFTTIKLDQIMPISQ